jgi:putative peptidoglycan lipid II flippase
MSAATLSSRILGMVRDMVAAAYFPPFVTDAYLVAFKLPNLFRRVLGEGSLAASFVPMYVEKLHREGHESAQRFSSAVFSMLTALTATLSVLGVVFMPVIMSYFVSGQGYMQIEGKLELTVFLARIMFGFLFLVTTYAFLMSVANAHKVFFVPAMAPALFNVATIVFAFLPTWIVPGDQLAWGVMVGGLLQVAIALWPLRLLKALPRLTRHWGGPGIKRFFQVLLPSMAGMSIAQLLGVLNVNFASRLGQGTHSYIYFADRILEFPQSLLSVSLGVALLPTLSEMWGKGEKNRFMETSERHMRLLLTLSLPAAVGIYVLAEPIIRVVFGRGEFGPEAISSTAQVLSIYSVVLVFSGLHRVLVPAFYAAQNTWWPAANSAFCLVVHYFVGSWAVDTHGLPGLIAATAFTGALNFLILVISFRIFFGEIRLLGLIKSALWLAPSLVAMAFVAQQSLSVVSRSWGEIIGLGVSIGLAVAVFFLVNAVLRHPEAREILGLIRRRARR